MKRYRIPEIKLEIKEGLELIPDKIRAKLRLRNLEINNWCVIKESIDARDKGQIQRVYTVEFETPEVLNLEEVTDAGYQFPPLEQIKQPSSPPVIVGFGPCGLFAAWVLAYLGFAPIVLERGKSIAARDLDVENFWKYGVLDEESNVQFGEGGAGAYSDGKLTTGTKDLRNRLVLETLVQAGADPEILYKKKPHVGTDVLKLVVTNIRKQIEQMGGEIRFHSKVTDILINDEKIQGVQINGNEIISTNDVILAIGHSARDTFRMLYQNGLTIEPKPFSMGIRIEHPQKLIDAAQYGEASLAKVLGPAEYKLVHHCKNGRGLYSFCMCPGGQVITTSSEAGGVVVNGMSFHARDGINANSGILTDVRVEDYYKSSPLDGLDFQRAVEIAAYAINGNENKPPKTTWGEFRKDPNNILRKCLPAFVTESILEGIPAFGKKIRGFDSPDARMTGVETRSSSPIRMPRNSEFMCNIHGLYPGGEGGGHAGGIVSAAVDGIRLAEAVATRVRTKD
jgi:uncharacterized FAD-dependent dehydrogenase